MVLGKMGLFALISRPKTSTAQGGRQDKQSQVWRHQEQRLASERSEAVDMPVSSVSPSGTPLSRVTSTATTVSLPSPATPIFPLAVAGEDGKQGQAPAVLAAGLTKPRGEAIEVAGKGTATVSGAMISPRGGVREQKEVGATGGGSGSLSCSTTEREDGHRGYASVGDASSQRLGELTVPSQGGSNRLKHQWGRGGLRRNVSSSAGLGSALSSGGGGSGKFSASGRSEDLSPSAMRAMVYVNAPVDNSPGRDVGGGPPDHLSDPGVYFNASFDPGQSGRGEGSGSSRHEKGQEAEEQAGHLSGSEFCGLSEGQVRWADRVPFERSRSDVALRVRAGRCFQVSLSREDEEDGDEASVPLSAPENGSQRGEGRSARSAPLHWTIGAEDEEEGQEDECAVVARSEPAPDNPDSPSGDSCEHEDRRRLGVERRHPSSSCDADEEEHVLNVDVAKDGRGSGSEVEEDSRPVEAQQEADDDLVRLCGSPSRQNAHAECLASEEEEQQQQLDDGIALAPDVKQTAPVVESPQRLAVAPKAAGLPLVPGGGSMARVQEWVARIAIEGSFPPEDSEREAYLEPPSPPASVGLEGGFVVPAAPHGQMKDTGVAGSLELAGTAGLLDADMAAASRCIAGLSRAAAAMHLAARGLKVVPPMASFGALKILHLAHNAIARIPAGSLPRSLHLLDLSHNKLTAIEGMRDLTKLRVLNLSHNRLTRIGHGLSACTSLRELYLSSNKIGEVEGLHRLLKLAVFDVANNKLTSTKALGQLAANYGSMQALNLNGNPIHANLGEDAFKRYICGLLPQLSYLNNSPLKPLSAREVASDNVARSSSTRSFGAGNKPSSTSRTVSRTDRSSSANRSKGGQPASTSSTSTQRHRRTHSTTSSAAAGAGTSRSSVARRGAVASNSSGSAAQHYSRGSADVPHGVRSATPLLALDTSHIMLAVQEVGGEGDGNAAGMMSKTPDLRMGYLPGSFTYGSAIAASAVPV